MTDAPLRVLVVSESFLPQVNGVTNSVRRVLEHLALEGHEAELVAPTGPASYAGFPVRTTRGASLPFYRDFRIGLETRARLRAEMLRFRPDVVHIASPATLGLQAARAAVELGIPSVAIYQTDLIGFAERYAKPGLGAGGIRAMVYLTRKIHTLADRTLAPSTASMRQLEDLAVPRLALWPRGVDLDAFHPGLRDEGLRRQLGGVSQSSAAPDAAQITRWRRCRPFEDAQSARVPAPCQPAPGRRRHPPRTERHTPAPDGRMLVGYVGRLAPEKELELLTYLSGDPRYALVVVGGGPEEGRLRRLMPDAHFLGVLHGAELGRAYAALDVFVHTGRHETYCQSAQEALASGVPVVAPRSGGPVDVVHDGVAGFLYEPGDGDDLGGYVDRLARDPEFRRRMGRAARRSVEGRSWRAVNEALVEHYREVAATMTGYRELAA